MISWLWLFPALLAGAVIGVWAIAICKVGDKDYEWKNEDWRNWDDE